MPRTTHTTTPLWATRCRKTPAPSSALTAPRYPSPTHPPPRFTTTAFSPYATHPTHYTCALYTTHTHPAVACYPWFRFATTCPACRAYTLPTFGGLVGWHAHALPAITARALPHFCTLFAHTLPVVSLVCGFPHLHTIGWFPNLPHLPRYTHTPHTPLPIYTFTCPFPHTTATTLHTFSYLPCSWVLDCGYCCYSAALCLPFTAISPTVTLITVGPACAHTTHIAAPRSPLPFPPYLQRTRLVPDLLRIVD